MRKIVSLLVIGLLLMTSLMAFAGGSDENFVHTLPEECMEHPVQTPSGGMTPRIDCNHTYGEERDYVFDQYDCGRYVEYYEISCRECGAFLRNEDTHYGNNDEHVGGLDYGDLYKENGYWYRDVFCAGCGEYLTTNVYDY